MKRGENVFNVNVENKNMKSNPIPKTRDNFQGDSLNSFYVVCFGH
jgi:hypothetical protein